jgi:hypothetical protein
LEGTVEERHWGFNPVKMFMQIQTADVESQFNSQHFKIIINVVSGLCDCIGDKVNPSVV